MKAFNIPVNYRSPVITHIKAERNTGDHLKKDFKPSVLDFGKVKINLARHFGFCYGVENAVETAYKAIEENPGKRIFLLSEIIHNPFVNLSLQQQGVRFITDTGGNQLIPWGEIREDDVVIIPAFGTTREVEGLLKQKGIRQVYYKSKCPFVEKVWTRAGQIAAKGYTVIVHGNPVHEETRATFSHSRSQGPSVVIKDMDEAYLLADFITGKRAPSLFGEFFSGRCSEGFDVNRDLRRIGVVNQTTLLASDTQDIADFLNDTMRAHFKLGRDTSAHFANMKDTLCYATHENQQAVINMLDQSADLAIVVGGYNSSNTSHLVELCESRLPTYFISSDAALVSDQEINHWDISSRQLHTTYRYLPQKDPLSVHLTSGASCPDILIENVITKLLSFFGLTIDTLSLRML
ncbi:4-hydroxy-3-methylbut-2-enyl diphosphate reductase [Dyadobacter jiangsuensis]|uniref:4-hydroxy-3-methylbut-2-enyl diphosphate reductase n=1 Tax=Dyadobacter jiangsuensis TaxID=1591085 RepID=A0A2P8FI81_9BACT|nr:4-hydroxy-3-methylbut-2-enyl diphosphate reductase [Dyadobacter jiangsuensis]PSL21432.1 4-hydroxy-3-methylbut-2-enyl diphosphate reductase [Dyadobacter jiangsuensis]